MFIVTLFCRRVTCTGTCPLLSGFEVIYACTRMGSEAPECVSSISKPSSHGQWLVYKAALFPRAVVVLNRSGKWKIGTLHPPSLFSPWEGVPPLLSSSLPIPIHLPLPFLSHSLTIPSLGRNSRAVAFGGASSSLKHLRFSGGGSGGGSSRFLFRTS